MSLAGYSQPDRTHRKSLHRRNDSGELDVFEAARYFSGYNDVVTDYNVGMNHHHSQKFSKDYQVPSSNKQYTAHQLLPKQSRALEKQMTMKEKKHRQPSSPGGKIASFLNSLFNQSATKKKKKSSKSASSAAQSMKDEEESSPAGWRRRRRSSISHFRTSSAVDSSSKSSSYYYSSTSSGFRTPPPYINTPTKSYKEFASYADHIHKQQSLSLPRNNIFRSKSNVINSSNINQVLSGSSTNRGSINEVKADDNKYYKLVDPAARNNIDNKFTSAEREIFIRKSLNQVDFDVDVDDGAESDSSSDLFELPNYDLGYCSSDLPVYETTRIDNIKPISNAAY